MKEWLRNSEDFLKFNERELLDGPGTKSHDSMVSYVENEYQIFDRNRKAVELQKAKEDLLKDTDEFVKVSKLKR